MKFKCNNTEYEIIEKEQLDNEEDVGFTEYQKKQILLKSLDKDFMIRTLKHELAHVWLYEYGHNQTDKEFNCEDVCEIVACSNDFINEIINKYIQDKNVCYVETKGWNELSKKQQKEILESLRKSPVKILPC